MTVRRAMAILLAVVTGIVLLVVARPATVERSAAEARRSESPDRRSAVVTATEFLTAIDLAVLLDDDRRDRVLARFATPAALDALRRTFAAEKRRVIASYRKPPRLARAALAGYRVEKLTESEAGVSIWAATIGGSGGFPPAAGWSTTTVKLSWDGERWKVSDVHDEPGPSAEWPIEALAQEVRAFEEYRHAP
jgi:hypothetical protein